ncbi:MAG: 50S ribosomal protein L19 [Bdellovibrionota bacterium]
MKKTVRRKTKSRGVLLALKGLAAKVAAVEAKLLRPDMPDFKAGDTVKVHTRVKEGEKERIQIYEGLVMARCHTGASKTFNVRKISHGVGVERIFLESSPTVAKVEVVQVGKIRRAKLYYMRELSGRAAKIERSVEGTVAAAAAAKAAAKEGTANVAAAKSKKE